MIATAPIHSPTITIIYTERKVFLVLRYHGPNVKTSGAEECDLRIRDSCPEICGAGALEGGDTSGHEVRFQGVFGWLGFFFKGCVGFMQEGVRLFLR